MQDFSTFTLQCIREDRSHMSWMEERRFDWTPLVASVITRLIEGHTFLLMTDKERDWFLQYTLNYLNKNSMDRPLLPIFSLKDAFLQMDNFSSKDDLNMVEDMLDLIFPNGFSYFYIGKGDSKYAQIAKSKDDSFMWLMDEKVQNSFYLNSKDEILDIKLIQLMRLFDKSINAILFAEVDIQGVL